MMLPRLLFRLVLLTALLILSLETILAENYPNLSPESWPPQERERFEKLSLRESSSSRPKPLAFSNGRGLVAGTDSPLAVQAGLHALRKDGNAMDACLTTALTDIVLSAGSHLSFAGVANILYYESATEKIHNLDAGWDIPQHINPLHIPSTHAKRRRGASVLVPGLIAGVEEAANKYGKFPLATLLGPALHFAQKGFTIPPKLADVIKKNYNSRTLLHTKQGRGTFTNPKTWKPYEAGELFKQKRLASFIHGLSRRGADYMYRGYWAEEMMVRAVQREHGYVTVQDMRDYRPRWLEPASTTYSGYHVFTSGAQWGGAELIETLNLLKEAGMGRVKDSYLTNATEFSWLATVAHLSHAITMFLQNRPAARDEIFDHFGLEFYPGDRYTTSSAHALWQSTRTPQKMKQMADFLDKKLADEHRKDRKPRSQAGGVVAVDKDGNVCALMHTADSEPWGTGLFVKGVPLPHPASIHSAMVRLTGPGQRLPSGLHPLIAYKANHGVETDSDKYRDQKFDKSQSKSSKCHSEKERLEEEESEELLTDPKGSFFKEKEEWSREEAEETEYHATEPPDFGPVLALATNGQTSKETVLQYLTNTLTRGLDPKAAVEFPGFYLDTSPKREIHVEENAFEPNLILEVKNLGQPVREVDFKTFGENSHGGVLLTIDHNKHQVLGCASPLADGLAAGEPVQGPA